MLPKVIDLFSGCGGLSLGLSQAGFSHLFALDAHKDAFATFQRNLIDRVPGSFDWPDWLEVGPHNVVKVLHTHRAQLEALKGTVALIAGGPPCQGFSTNGRRDPDDPRSRMVEAYLEFVGAIRPKLVLLENVRGFTTMLHPTGITYAEHVERRLGELGYQVWSTVLSASDWGVPQRRPRYILIAAPEGTLPGIDPLVRLRVARRGFLSARGLWPGPTTTREALSDLETAGRSLRLDPEWGSRGFHALDYDEPRELSPFQRLVRRGATGAPSDMRLANHRQVATERMEAILATCRPGTTLNAAEREKVGLLKRTTIPLDPNSPSPTITTLPDDLVHYCEPRTMTVREHARLQSFPDWFAFRGPYTSGGLGRREACPRYTQVANAVPPLFAEALGETLLGLLRSQKPLDGPKVLEVLEEVAP